MEPKYHHHEVGFNSRLDALQAAVLRVKLRKLELWTEARRQAAGRYRELFDLHGLSEFLTLPEELPDRRHVYNQFVVRTPESQRDGLRSFLSSRGVGSEIYYPIPLHLQVCFRSLGYSEGDFPVSEAAAKETIALPMFPELTADDQSHVASTIAEFFGA